MTLGFSSSCWNSFRCFTDVSVGWYSGLLFPTIGIIPLKIVLVVQYSDIFSSGQIHRLFVDSVQGLVLLLLISP